MNYIYNIFLCLVLVCSFNCHATEYKPWNENLFSYIKEQYGEDAEKRMHLLHNLILNNQDKTEMEKLDLVNNALNIVPWIADKNLWKEADYWASPLEVVTTFGGDCEDISFTKWITLRHLGIPKDKLYFGYVQLTEYDQAHMVLLYKVSPELPFGESKVYILDNVDPEIKLAKERNDLKGVYIIAPSGELTTLKNIDGEYTEAKIFDGRKLKNYKNFRKKFFEDREKLKEVNGGEYLLPDL